MSAFFAKLGWSIDPVLNWLTFSWAIWTKRNHRRREVRSRRRRRLWRDTKMRCSSIVRSRHSSKPWCKLIQTSDSTSKSSIRCFKRSPLFCLSTPPPPHNTKLILFRMVLGNANIIGSATNILTSFSLKSWIMPKIVASSSAPSILTFALCTRRAN